MCGVAGWHCLGEDGSGHRADLEHQPQAPEQPPVWGTVTVALSRLGWWEGVPGAWVCVCELGSCCGGEGSRLTSPCALTAFPGSCADGYLVGTHSPRRAACGQYQATVQASGPHPGSQEQTGAEPGSEENPPSLGEGLSRGDRVHASGHTRPQCWKQTLSHLFPPWPVRSTGRGFWFHTHFLSNCVRR